MFVFDLYSIPLGVHVVLSITSLLYELTCCMWVDVVNMLIECCLDIYCCKNKPNVTLLLFTLTFTFTFTFTLPSTL